ncbi:MAG: lipopolysaccharide biosynthesis protein [Blastocatellales bacterium]
MSFVDVSQRARQVWSVLRLTPFDTSTDEERSKERYRRVILGAAAFGTSKAITALTTLISVPLTVNYLGAERYGLWMTISSVIVMLGFADLGLGNGLVNAIAEAHGRDDRMAASRYVSSGFFMLLGVAVLILVAFALAYRFVAWPWVFNVTSDAAAREAGPALAVFVVCFAAGIPLGIVQRVQLGYQEGFASSIWQSAGSLGGLVGVVLAIYHQVGLPWLVLAMSGAPVLATAVNWMVQFLWRRPWLCPRWSQVDLGAGRKIANLGMLFLVLQLLTLMGSASDNLIIAQMFGASAVAGYAVVQKLFSIALLSQFFVAPLWPAFGEALARHDYSWVARTLRRSILISVALGGCAALPLLVFGRQIIAFWAGGQLTPSIALLAGFAAHAVLGGYGGAMSAFLNSGSLLGRQVSFYGAASIAALILKVALARYWQVAGVIWATVIAYGTLYAIPSWLLSHQHLLHSRERSHAAR